MFKLKIDLEKGLIQAAGSTVDIVTDLLVAINEIHALMARRDKASAEFFRKALVAGINDPDSPCFKGESLPGMSYIFSKGKKDGAK